MTYDDLLDWLDDNDFFDWDDSWYDNYDNIVDNWEGRGNFEDIISRGYFKEWFNEQVTYENSLDNFMEPFSEWIEPIYKGFVSFSQSESLLDWLFGE